jgi:hypothetical protein
VVGCDPLLRGAHADEAARAQQPERMRRIGVLSVQTASDLASAVAMFEKTLRRSGRGDGRNVRIDYRWSVGNADNICKNDPRSTASFCETSPELI